MGVEVVVADWVQPWVADTLPLEQVADTSPRASEEEGTWTLADWEADMWAWAPQLEVVVEEAGWERPWVADTWPPVRGAGTSLQALREADKLPWAVEVVAVAGKPWAAGTSGEVSLEVHSYIR